MSASQGVGDRHPGQWLPFWERACREGRPRACAYLANLQSIFCNAGSGWACNEAVIPTTNASLLPVARRRRDRRRDDSFISSEAAGSGSCPHAGTPSDWSNGTRPFERAPPTLADYPHPASRQQGTHHRPHAVSAVRARLRAGLAATPAAQPASSAFYSVARSLAAALSRWAAVYLATGF